MKDEPKIRPVWDGFAPMELSASCARVRGAPSAAGGCCQEDAQDEIAAWPCPAGGHSLSRVHGEHPQRLLFSAWNGSNTPPFVWMYPVARQEVLFPVLFPPKQITR